MDNDAGHAPAIGASSIGTRRLCALEKDSARARAGWGVGMMMTSYAKLESVRLYLDVRRIDGKCCKGYQTLLVLS
jgi:hypothetical protein